MAGLVSMPFGNSLRISPGALELHPFRVLQAEGLQLHSPAQRAGMNDHQAKLLHPVGVQLLHPARPIFVAPLQGAYCFLAALVPGALPRALELHPFRVLQAACVAFELPKGIGPGVVSRK
jgi:hypothetical protein